MGEFLSVLAQRPKDRTLPGGFVVSGEPAPDLAGACVPVTGPRGESLSARFLDRERLRAGAAADLPRIAAFRHPTGMPIVASGEEDGVPFIVEHALSGVFAADFLERCRAERKGAPAFFIVDPEEAKGRTGNIPREPYWRAICRIGIDLGRCLHAYRQTGLVPTSPAPEWILFRRDGNAVFRVLGLLGDEVPDPREEVYRLGRILRSLATLEPLAGTPERAPPRRIEPMLNERMELILLAATADRPSGRYADAGEFAADLDRYLTHQPIAARRPGLFLRCLGAKPRAR
jgi:hypothetical protein